VRRAAEAGEDYHWSDIGAYRFELLGEFEGCDWVHLAATGAAEFVELEVRRQLVAGHVVCQYPWKSTAEPMPISISM
jgi:hypothetical protein